MTGLQSVSAISTGVELGYVDQTKNTVLSTGIVSNLSSSDSKADVDIYFHKYSALESIKLTGAIGILVIKKGIAPPIDWWVKIDNK